jgi:hypothetical protein
MIGNQKQNQNESEEQKQKEDEEEYWEMMNITRDWNQR